MSFLSLYRKYRPENFNDLIGQDQVIQTLKNALKNDRVAHAYLFAGPRGTGKTSTAKVFAKSLNCANPSENFEPCGECNSCQRINKGNSLDVIEIDAASNRGIDEIRELREKVKFYPGEGKYKVYIIDEVHMLTKGAFNALLKTLEEPPDSVVFILATTEPHEVITTIMSRCQRFDFTLLTLSNLKKRLQYIADAEGYEIENKALDILARSARGGMRDAISLLDQAISFSDGKLNSTEIARMLGRINKEDLQEFLIHISKEQSQKALELLDKQLESGLGIERFSDELIEYCRELLLIKECGIDSGILEYSRSYLEDLASVASNLSTQRITTIIDEFAALKQKLRSSARPRLQLEISVIKLSSRGSGSSAIENRLSELEFKFENLLKGNINTDSTSTVKKEKTQETVSEKQKSSFSDQVKRTRTEESSKSKNSESKNKDNLESDSNQVEAEANVTQSDNALTLTRIKENWAMVLNEIRQLDVSVQALLREGAPADVKGNTVIIAFPESKKFHYKGAASNQALIAKVLRNVLNEAVELEFQLGVKKKELNNSEKDKNFTTASEDKNNINIHKEADSAVDQVFDSNPTADISSKSTNQDQKQEQTKDDLENIDDLGIEKLARVFSGEIIEVDESILKKRGGN